MAFMTHEPRSCQPDASGSVASQAPAAQRRGSHARLPRRAWLAGGLATGLVGGVVAGLAQRWWTATKRQRGARTPVFLARHQRYDGDLVRTIRDGLAACGFSASSVRGRRVLLKPNLVEPLRGCPQMTTHPAVVVAAAEVFRAWGAMVVVGEGPGHLRDTELALAESGMREALLAARLPFADLNYEDVAWRPNRGRQSKLAGFWFPRSVVEADWIVSLPKMKTHHWVGVTAALKNMYGTIPGCKYGWPKNVLHYQGIPQTVFDINASLPPTIAIVDGIDCMEGDGPIMGTLKPMGLILVGTCPTAVDATVCRLMQVDPWAVPYLALAEGKLGPLAEPQIEQRGEHWQPLAQPFEILDKPHLRNLIRHRGVLVS
jgi:uncharacterized protein (DUF362 family)